MKKIILSALCLAQIGYVSSQVSKLSTPINKLEKLSTKEMNQIPPMLSSNDKGFDEKALGQVVWSDNFSTPANWSIDNDGQTEATFGWSIGTSGASWYTGGGLSNAINSTSDGNFANLQNGNYFTNTQATNVVYTMTTAVPIDLETLAGTDQVNLKFEQFGALFNDAQEVLISTNGTDYSLAYTNTGREVFNGTNPGAIYANSETIIVDVSPILEAAANTTTVYVQFRWTTRFPSDPSLNAWTTFGWKIDDVEFITKPDNDAKVVSSYWGTNGLKYYRVPLTQVAEVDFSADVVNSGQNELKTTTFSVDVNTGAWMESSASQDVMPNDTVTFTTLPYIPSALGTYSSAYSIIHDSIDDVPSNNLIAATSFEVTNFTFARDNNSMNGYTFVNDSTEYEVGNYFEVTVPQTVYAVDVVLSDQSEVDSEFSALIYEDTGGDSYIDAMQYVTESMIVLSEASMFGNVTTLNLVQPVELEPGKSYYVVVISYDGLLNISTGGLSDGYSYLWNDNQLALQNLTPVIRLNFDPSVSLTENELLNNVSVFPNPSTNDAKVEFNLANASDVTINVTDITGKTVETIKLGNVNAGVSSANLNVANYATGIYNVVITTNETSVTSKLIKK